MIVRTGTPHRRFGLGQCVRQYYQMPDQATQDMLAAQGCSIQIIPGPRNSFPTVTGGSYASTAQPVTPLPSSPSCDMQAGLLNCSPNDVACVQGNLDRWVANGEACAQAMADYNRTVCEHNWDLNRNQYMALGLPVPPNTCGQQFTGASPYGVTNPPYVPPPSEPTVTVAVAPTTGANAGLPAEAAAITAHTSDFDLGGFLSGRAFLNIPNWVWMAGAGALFFWGRNR